MRFMGWLRRSLRDLGEDMIFNLDSRDPAVGNILDSFFQELHQKGALRGAQPEDAYRLINLSNQPNLIHYQIEIAPSFPVDRFVVTFMHNSKANSLTLPINAPRRFSLYNGAINRFSIDRQIWHLDTWGDLSHLDGKGSLDDR